MKHLLEISKIVTKKKIKKIEIFDEHSLRHKTSKFNEFYEALLAGKFKNDRDAATFLYACTPTDDKYRQLKSRFRKRLLNTLFFLDINIPGTSNYNRAYYTVNKEWTLVKILLSNNAPQTAADIAKQILTIALKFKFADVIVNCSRILRQYAASTGDEEGDYELYDQYAKQYQDVLNAEIRSEELYQRVVMNYHIPTETKALHEKIDTYCEALVGLSEMYDSPIIIYNMYMVWAYRYEMLSDYPSVLEICKKAEQYIQDNPIYYRDDMLADFQLKAMNAYLHLGDYKNGKITAEKCLVTFPDGMETWYDIMEFYFLLSMHTENYAGALAIYNEAVNHLRFKKASSTLREKWNIYDVYLNYMIDVNSEKNPVLKGQNTKTFRLSKLLNDAVLYPKDQRALATFMYIAQILYLIEKKTFNAAGEKIERLKVFATRQLKKEENFRVHQFIRLLSQLNRADFKQSELNTDSKYFERLQTTPFKYTGLTHELEIIPYDKLWAILLDRIRK